MAKSTISAMFQFANCLSLPEANLVNLKIPRKNDCPIHRRVMIEQTTQEDSSENEQKQWRRKMSKRSKTSGTQNSKKKVWKAVYRCLMMFNDVYSIPHSVSIDLSCNPHSTSQCLRVSQRQQRSTDHCSGWWRTISADYPLVILHSYGTSPFLMGKLTINGHVQ